ncbi:MAG: DUF934 domain-containing protein [Pseudohongiellaceae bacterium]
MPKLIKDSLLIEDIWHLIEKDTDITILESIGTNHIIVPVKLWADNKKLLSLHKNNIGIWFDSNENLTLLDEEPNDFSVIALNFPVFRDGRSYSNAAILRQQLNYIGDIRAIGDIRRDQASYMLSCGFTSFLIPDDIDIGVFLTGFHDFSENYQSTVANPTPLFRRR